ncbi:hypothetical protein AMECASPLE_009333 [Ameca splendens]|uniref:Uncharacterized protein n=1 Tax=Ameca splendens TaxID=208324 RepID=A0ABV0XP66_9TELE
MKRDWTPPVSGSAGRDPTAVSDPDLCNISQVWSAEANPPPLGSAGEPRPPAVRTEEPGQSNSDWRRQESRDEGNCFRCRCCRSWRILFLASDKACCPSASSCSSCSVSENLPL